MADDLEADIRAAMGQAGDISSGGSNPPPDAGSGSAASASPASPEPASPAPEKPEFKTDAERARDEAGRFTKKDDKAVAEAPKPEAPANDTATAPQGQQAAPKPGETPAPDIAPPLNWKGAGKVDWKRLPKSIQQEISQEYTRAAEAQTKLQKFESAIGPERAQVLSATYGSVEQGLQNLFAVSDMATKNPTGFVLWFAQQRGINLVQMVQQALQQGGGQPPAQQQADPIAQRLNQLETMFQGYLQQQQQGTQTQLMSEIDRFAADPAHPYFNDVRADMAILMEKGRAKDLQQAYDMAVWANPETRQTLIAEQKQQFTSQQTNVAQQALNASSSISGSPAGAKIANAEPNETLEQTIIRAQRMHAGS